jgi:capsular polysaccharide biosynthesis protein
MRPRSGGRGEHLLVALTRLYGALLVLYPKPFRRRYEAEMRRDFRELSREGLQEGGAKELVRVLAQALSDLVLTALRERGTTAARRYASYLSVEPRIAVRAAARAMVAVVLVSVGVVAASLLQTPTYEPSALVLVGGQQEDQWTNSGGSGEGIQTLEWVELPTQEMIHAIDSRPVAEGAIKRLGLQMKPAELLDSLTVEQLENTQRFIVLSYEDTDPVEATRIANTVGEVSSELISERSAARIQLTANVYEKAGVPLAPASPHPLRNGLLTLVMGLVLCVGLVVARPSLAASVAGKLGRPAVRQGVGQAGIPAVLSAVPSEVERLKEKEVLEALERRGKLTAVEAALETSLSVGGAERMLQALTAEGHLQVTVEHGRLYYAFWEHHAP